MMNYNLPVSDQRLLCDPRVTVLNLLGVSEVEQLSSEVLFILKKV